jgi:uncharacterized protein YdeI (YjbR/CyaY-like superfamily)
MNQTAQRKPQSASRTVNVPADLRQALRADAATQAIFEALPPSHQREYAMDSKGFCQAVRRDVGG